MQLSKPTLSLDESNPLHPYRNSPALAGDPAEPLGAFYYLAKTLPQKAHRRSYYGQGLGGDDEPAQGSPTRQIPVPYTHIFRRLNGSVIGEVSNVQHKYSPDQHAGCSASPPGFKRIVSKSNRHKILNNSEIMKRQSTFSQKS